MKGLTLNQREQARLDILNRVLQGWVYVHEAAPLGSIPEGGCRCTCAWESGAPGSEYDDARGEGQGGDSGGGSAFGTRGSSAGVRRDPCGEG